MDLAQELMKSDAEKLKDIDNTLDMMFIDAANHYISAYAHFMKNHRRSQFTQRENEKLATLAAKQEQAWLTRETIKTIIKGEQNND